MNRFQNKNQTVYKMDLFLSHTSDSMPSSINVASVSAAQMILFNNCSSDRLVTDEKSSKTCF